MKKSLILLASLISLSGFAATETMKLKSSKPMPASVTQTSEISVSLAQPEVKLHTTALVTTNLAELTKSNANVALNVMMTNYAALALTYASSSEREARKRLNNQQATVDRATTGIGFSYYFFGIEAAKNIAVTPTLIFQSEKDALYSENNNGLGLKLVGIFKPAPRVLLEAGINSTIVSGDTKGEGYLGLGLLF